MAKNYKSGVQLVDFSGTVFTAGTATTIAGAHTVIANQNSKRTVLHDFSIGTVKYPDIDVALSLGENGTYTGKFLFGTATITVTISNADAVTFAIA